MSDFKEWATYWYFRFPKWVWTALILGLIVLLNVVAANIMPYEWLFGSERDGSVPIWALRLTTFYFTVVIGGILFFIVGGTLIMLVSEIYGTLPDDPRKAKGEEE